MSKTILVVDDSGSFRTVVKLALQKAGYAVVEAMDGKDACGKLNGQKFNLIVCDVNMPNMDGLSFLRHVKAQAAYKFTPVIMLTTESQDARPRRRGQGLDHQALPALAAGGRRQPPVRVTP